MMTPSVAENKWYETKTFYRVLKCNISILNDRGLSFKKILALSKVETIFLCAIFCVLNRQDIAATGIISLLSAADRAKYDKYVEFLRFIEYDEYDTLLKKEGGSEPALRKRGMSRVEAAIREMDVASEVNKKLCIARDEEISRMVNGAEISRRASEPESEEDKEEEGEVPGKGLEHHRGKKNDGLSSKAEADEVSGKEGKNSRKRVRFTPNEQAETETTLIRANKTVQDDNQEGRPPKRARLDAALDIQEVFQLASQVRLSINDYTLMLLEQEAQQSPLRRLRREFITQELSLSLNQLRENEDGIIEEQAARDGALAVYVRLHAALERFRFKGYELSSRRGSAETETEVKTETEMEVETDRLEELPALTADEAEKELAQRIELVQAVVDASTDRPGVVDRPTLDRAVSAGVFVSKRCEQYLTAVLARATELCVASAAVTAAARERLAQLETGRGETAPEQEEEQGGGGGGETKTG